MKRQVYAEKDSIVRSKPWTLVADIGGTNARFAAITVDTLQDDIAVRIIPTAQSPNFLTTLTDIISELGDSADLNRIILGVAAPVDSDIIPLTNANWIIDRNQLKTAFKGIPIHLLNDFEALALSLPHLAPWDIHVLQQGTRKVAGNFAVLGAGTGLGVAGLIAEGVNGHTILAGEGGHVTYAPETELEYHLKDELSQLYGGRVSTERLACGQGLVDTARILGANIKTAKDVTTLSAEGSSEACRQAVTVFLRTMGRIAGDYALTINARAGVFLAGGIIPEVLKSHDPAPLLDTFLDKGRFSERMQSIPLSIITNPLPAFIGLHAFAQSRISDN